MRAALAVNSDAGLFDRQFVLAECVAEKFAADNEGGNLDQVIASLREMLKRVPDQARVKFHIHRVLGLLLQAAGNTDEANVHFELSYNLNPKDSSAALFAIVVARRGDLNRALEILDGVPTKFESNNNRYLRIQILVNRGAPGDRELAKSLMKLGVPLENDSPRFREGWHIQLVRLQIDLNELVEAAAELSNPAIGKENRAVLEVMISKAQGDADLARKKALMLASRSQDFDSISFDLLNDLAFLLEHVSEPHAALVIWKHLMVSISDAKLISHVLHLARTCHDLEFVVDCCSERRRTSGYDPKFVDLEISAQAGISPSTAIQTLLDLSNSDIPLAEKRFLRFRLALFGLSLNRPDLIEADPSNLPHSSEIRENMIVPLVEVLKHSRDPMSALRTGVRLL